MDSRRRFLEVLERPFRDLAPEIEFEYVEGAPFPSAALSAEVPGRQGGIRVTAFSLSQGVKEYGDPFPGRGVPHWELYAVDQKGKLGESVVSCREDVIVRAFEDWLHLGAPTPDLQSKPPSRDHLSRIGHTAALEPSLALRGEAVAAAARLPVEERQRFEADVRSLAGPRIAHFFPRGDDGRVGSGSMVLLTAYGSEERRGRRLWLHAVATRKRSLEIGLDALIGENHAHRWEGARWMWDGRIEMPPRVSAGESTRPTLASAEPSNCSTRGILEKPLRSGASAGRRR